MRGSRRYVLLLLDPTLAGDAATASAAGDMVRELSACTTFRQTSTPSATLAQFLVPPELCVACVVPGAAEAPAWRSCRSDRGVAAAVERTVAAPRGDGACIAPCASAAIALDALVGAARAMHSSARGRAAAQRDPLAPRSERDGENEVAAMVDVVWLCPAVAPDASARSLCVAPDSDGGVALYGALRRALLFAGEDRSVAHIVGAADDAEWCRDWRLLLRAVPAQARGARPSLQWRGELMLHGHVVGAALHTRAPFAPALPSYLRHGAVDGSARGAGPARGPALRALPPRAAQRAPAASALRAVRSARVAQRSLSALLQMYAKRSFALVDHWHGGGSRGNGALATAWAEAEQGVFATAAPGTVLVAVAVATRGDERRAGRGSAPVTFLLVGSNARSGAGRSAESGGGAFELDAYLLSPTAALRFAVLAATSSRAELGAAALAEPERGAHGNGAGAGNGLAQLPLLTPSVLAREEARIAAAQLAACAQLGGTAVDLATFVSLAEQVRTRALASRRAEWAARGANAALRAGAALSAPRRDAAPGSKAEEETAPPKAAPTTAAPAGKEKSKAKRAVRRRSRRSAAGCANDAMLARRIAAGQTTAVKRGPSSAGVSFLYVPLHFTRILLTV